MKLSQGLLRRDKFNFEQLEEQSLFQNEEPSENEEEWRSLSILPTLPVPEITPFLTIPSPRKHRYHNPKI